MAKKGMYFTAGEVGAARAAFLADWAAGGEEATFSEWVTEQVRHYAALTPEDRVQRWSDRARSESDPPRQLRTVDVDDAVLQTAYQAIAADNEHGRWPSDSRWFGQAVAQGVARTIEREGELATAPAKLPNRRLVRREFCAGPLPDRERT